MNSFIHLAPSVQMPRACCPPSVRLSRAAPARAPSPDLIVHACGGKSSRLLPSGVAATGHAWPHTPSARMLLVCVMLLLTGRI
jgi:hypothetical protein